MKHKNNYLIVLLLRLCAPAYAQDCSSLNIQYHTDLVSSCNQMVLAMHQDALNRPYLYVANKEAGLKIYNVANIDAPFFVAQIPASMMDGLDVMNLSQQGNDLYLALGNHFTNPQSGGFAIIDVSDPVMPVLKDHWKNSAASDGGGGIVVADGDFAYLGAMKYGLMIFNVADKSHIQFVSQYLPDIYYPDPTPNPDHINARGMAVRDNKVYLCYDAGGLRVVDVSNKTAPVEIGRYSNPALNGLASAYNNILLDDSLAYIAVDYCGMEILNIADPQQIKLVGWWNPWHCQSNPLNWFVSPGHTNEIAYNKACKQIFLSSGKSDLHVVNVENPALPDSCSMYGGVDNGIGTWGMSIFDDRIYLAYICNPLPFPFQSTWTAVKILRYTPCISEVAEPGTTGIEIFPNPAIDQITLRNTESAHFNGVVRYQIF